MARYRLLWLELARDYYASMPGETRDQVDDRLEQLLENPRTPDAGYDQLTDQWTTTYGDGAGVLLYAVVHGHEAVIVLRLL